MTKELNLGTLQFMTLLTIWAKFQVAICFYIVSFMIVEAVCLSIIQHTAIGQMLQLLS